jgi:3-deoxy-7-phosphoheptulonate synthase
VIRVYLEKPRSTTGWKGFINDPFMDGSNNISEGLKLSRKLLISIAEKGFPIATEFLDVLVYPYIEDLISFGAVGARTSESQTHRQMVSSFSFPVGFKNATSGNIDVAINGIISAKSLHSFIGINSDGDVSKVTTKGNPYGFLILRGGDNGPNYEEEFIKETQERLKEKSLFKKVLIDCSHGNSMKDYHNQKLVFRDVITQMDSNPDVIGVMLESYIHEGSQKIELNNIKKGVSVTDSCISIDETKKLILEAKEHM